MTDLLPLTFEEEDNGMETDVSLEFSRSPFSILLLSYDLGSRYIYRVGAKGVTYNR